MLVIVRILIMSSVCGSLVVRIKGQPYHMFLAFRHMSPALPELAIFFFRSLPFVTEVIALPPSILPLLKGSLDYIWSYLPREPCCMNRRDEVSRSLSTLWGVDGGAQEVLTRERTEMKVDSPRLRASCHKWTDRRITWNLNWFLWVRERERESERNFRYLLTSLDGMCQWQAKDGGNRKSVDRQRNVISGNDKWEPFEKRRWSGPVPETLTVTSSWI